MQRPSPQTVSTNQVAVIAGAACTVLPSTQIAGVSTSGCSGQSSKVATHDPSQHVTKPSSSQLVHPPSNDPPHIPQQSYGASHALSSAVSKQ